MRHKFEITFFHNKHQEGDICNILIKVSLFSFPLPRTRYAKAAFRSIETLYAEETQTQPKASNAVYDATAQLVGEKVQRKAVFVDRRASRIFE